VQHCAFDSTTSLRDCSGCRNVVLVGRTVVIVRSVFDTIETNKRVCATQRNDVRRACGTEKDT
jgi:hypothetical protein